MTRSRNGLFIAAGMRAVAVSFISVFLGIDFAQRNLGASWIGFIVAAGLLGNTLSGLLVSWIGRKIQLRILLTLLTILMAMCGILLAAPLPFWLLAGVACLGLLNGMGRDRSGLRALDQSILPQTAPDEKRTFLFAIYNVVITLSEATGAGLAIFPEKITKWFQLGIGASHFAGYWIYALLLFMSALFYFFFAPKFGRVQELEVQCKPVSTTTKKKVWNLAVLFLIDSLGGGFLTTTLIAYWFFVKFHPATSTIALLILLARILNSLSNFAAVWLSRRIGLVFTMVLTHLPGSLLLIVAAFAPTFPIAAALFLIREALMQMDVPARESYVMAIVSNDERPFAAGLTTMVRNLGWTITPALAGAGMAAISPAFALVTGSLFKIAYDVLLYLKFRRIKPPEESQS